MNNITYKTLKFKTDESLLDNMDYCKDLNDFELRRLTVKEYKDILHVLFSKRLASDILSVLTLLIAIFATSTFSTVSFLAVSFIFLVVRFRLVAKYRGYFRTLKMIVSLIDMEIKEKYGMDMETV